ncbi:MAG: hypothetical protein ACE5HV_06055 [Acidobacteriota bacterium]
MKRIMTMALVVSLVAGTALADVPKQVKEPTSLAEAAAVAAEKVVADEAPAVESHLTLAPQGQERGVAGWKLAVGIGLAAGAAGLFINAANLRPGATDVFGRQKNADASLSFGVGVAFAISSVFAIRGALKGRSFHN